MARCLLLLIMMTTAGCATLDQREGMLMVQGRLETGDGCFLGMLEFHEDRAPVYASKAVIAGNFREQFPLAPSAYYHRVWMECGGVTIASREGARPRTVSRVDIDLGPVGMKARP